jgi:RNA polymerase sigma factor (sigma-70 family)
VGIEGRHRFEALPPGSMGAFADECTTDAHLQHALAAVYVEYSKRFHEVLCKAFVHAPVPVLTAADVDDAIQNAFVRVLQTCHGGRSEIRVLAAYLFGVARNVCLDEVRTRRARKRILQGQLDGSRHDDDDGLRPMLAVDIRFVAQWLSKAPKILFDIYELRFTAGLSQNDTARRLGVSRKRVRYLEARLLNEMRGAFGVSGALPSAAPSCDEIARWCS